MAEDTRQATLPSTLPALPAPPAMPTQLTLRETPLLPMPAAA